MFGRETRMLLKHYLEQGASKSALARRLGVSRDTLHRWIRDGELDRDLETTTVHYGPRPPVATKADAYRGIVEARLAVYPQLSAVRLLDEIRAAGYTGGYSQLKAFVRQVRPVSTPAPIIRFETPRRSPGAGGLRPLPLRLGCPCARPCPVCVARGARLLAVAVVPLLCAAGHADAGERPRGGVPGVWRGAAGDSASRRTLGPTSSVVLSPQHKARVTSESL
jgi:hypothetical protein